MILVKVGGGKYINWNYIAYDLCNFKEKVVLVHGANSYVKDISQKFGIEEKIIISPSGHTSRYTDQETMDLMIMVYSGLVNKKIVALLQKHGIKTVGLTGADGKIWCGKRKEAILSKEGNRIKIIRDSQTGTVESVNVSLINLLVDNGYLPLITIPAITDKGELINVDNDRAVAVMAKELNIKKIVMLFEAPGLLKDANNQHSLIKKINCQDLDLYLKDSKGRIKKKLLGVKEALRYGVKKVYFGDGRVRSPITKALSGKGTIIS